MEVGEKREAINQVETGRGVLLCMIVWEPMIKTKNLSQLSHGACQHGICSHYSTINGKYCGFVQVLWIFR